MVAVNDERGAGRTREKVGVEERAMLSKMEGLKGGGREGREGKSDSCFKLVTPWVNRQVSESA